MSIVLQITDFSHLKQRELTRPREERDTRLQTTQGPSRVTDRTGRETDIPSTPPLVIHYLAPTAQVRERLSDSAPDWWPLVALVVWLAVAAALGVWP